MFEGFSVQVSGFRKKKRFGSRNASVDRGLRYPDSLKPET
jgi:hypothetical protein